MATKSTCHRGNFTPQEIRPLVATARRAYDYQQRLGNIGTDDDFDAWRHRHVFAVTGKPGLTACHHDDFRPLRAHFAELAGLDDQAFGDHMTTGPAGADPTDTHEGRRVIAHHIVQAVEEHHFRGGSIGPGYIVATARRQTGRPRLTLGRDLRAGLADRCSVAQLTQIRATILNRLAAKDGRGKSLTRNKSQRPVA